MAQALETAVEEIVNVLKNVQGLKWVPINPTETVSYDTFAIVYPSSGVYEVAPVDYREALHEISIDILTKRTDLARNFQTLKPLIDLVATALLGQISYINGVPASVFNNSISTFASLNYSWVASDYGGVPVIGYHFTMVNVKIHVEQ